MTETFEHWFYYYYFVECIWKDIEVSVLIKNHPQWNVLNTKAFEYIHLKNKNTINYQLYFCPFGFRWMEGGLQQFLFIYLFCQILIQHCSTHSIVFLKVKLNAAISRLIQCTLIGFTKGFTPWVPRIVSTRCQIKHCDILRKFGVCEDSVLWNSVSWTLEDVLWQQCKIIQIQPHKRTFFDTEEHPLNN